MNPYGLCIYSFLAFEEVTETYGLRKNTYFRFPPHYEISQIAQACFLLISETSWDFIYCATKDAKYLKAANQRLHVIK